MFEMILLAYIKHSLLLAFSMMAVMGFSRREADRSAVTNHGSSKKVNHESDRKIRLREEVGEAKFA